MGKFKKIEFNGKDLTVSELDVDQVIEIIDGFKNYEAHILDILMDQPITANVIFLAADMSPKDFDGKLCPSELEQLYEAVISVNPTLTAAMKRLQAVGARVLQSKSSPSS